jgi:hypothetical protein
MDTLAFPFDCMVLPMTDPYQLALPLKVIPAFGA